MNAPNHIAGGIVLTGIVTSFSDINILSDPLMLGVTAFAAILPDIDHPHSLLGKAVKPVSNYLNKNYGHRTITHSLTAVLAVYLFVGFIEVLFNLESSWSTVITVAYFSHLFLDMMTLSGIPFLYPFKRNRFVLPGDDKYRMRGGDRKGEVIAFVILMCLGMFLQPLFADGFWTKYNEFFATPKHLSMEFKRATDVIDVEITYSSGSENFIESGYCLKATESEIVILQDDRILSLDLKETPVKNIALNHTGVKYFIDKYYFDEIDLDSFKVLCDADVIKEIDFSSNVPFVMPPYSVELVNKFKGDFLRYASVKPKAEKVVLDSFRYIKNLEIPFLHRKLKLLEDEKKVIAKVQLLEEKQHKALINRLDNCVDLFEREQLVHDLRKFKINDYSKEVLSLERRIIALKNDIELKTLKERFDNELKKNEVNLSNSKLKNIEPSFSGYMVAIRFQNDAIYKEHLSQK